MLEAWFATLASRLGVNNSKKDGSDMPQALQQAMENLWSMALAISQNHADEKLAQAKADLNEAKQALELRENKLLQQHQVLVTQNAAFEVSVRVAADRADDLASRLNQAQMLISKRETEIELLRQKIVLIEDECAVERRRSAEAASMQTQEREKYERRVDATHHKLLQDIDRGRQEVQKIKSDKQAAEKQFEAAHIAWQQKNKSHENDLLKAQELLSVKVADIKALHEALAVSNANLDELRDLLQKHQTGSEATIARLTEVFSSTARRLTNKQIAPRKTRFQNRK
jgi:chromosome segregation ATPase